jgi:hypothetical protein
LPYPLAEPLKRYLSETDQRSLKSVGIEFIEAALALGAYTSFFESCLGRKNKAAQFSGFRQRSAGPLWGLIKNLAAQLKGRTQITTPYQDLLRHEFDLVEAAIKFVSDYKHHKTDESFNLHRVVIVLANTAVRAFSGWHLGRFEHVYKKQFSKVNEGLFRHASGCPPFMWLQMYHGKENYSPEQTFLQDHDTGRLLALEPLLFVDRCPKHTLTEGAEPHWYLFDKYDEKKDIFSFKAVGYSCSIDIGKSDSRVGIYESLKEFTAVRLEIEQNELFTVIE